MTNTWRRLPGAQPPHQQHVRRFGENVRQRSASSALRLPQGGSSNCGWLPQALHRVRRGHSGHAAKQARHELLTHPGLCRRLDRHSVAPPIPEREQTALPLSQ
eukprot:SM000009S23566  [mRNA]  locus=s9:736076:736707:- [translate_table: standard]